MRTDFLCICWEIDNARVLLADLYEISGNTTSGHSQAGTHRSHSGRSHSSHPSNSTSSRVAFHRAQASLLRSAILDLFWDPKKLAFYDFNRTSGARGTVRSLFSLLLFPFNCFSIFTQIIGGFGALALMMHFFFF